MRLRLFVAIAAVLIGVTAPRAAASDPVASLQGLFSDGDCEAVPELLGSWNAVDDLGGTWTLQKLGERKYRLLAARKEPDTYREAFDLCVAHLGGYLFFDATLHRLRPSGDALSYDDQELWVPLHLFGRLDVESDALRFRGLDDGWLQDALKSGYVHLTTAQPDEGDDSVILTGGRKELREFAEKFATDAQAFSDEERFERVEAE